jgi:hypothetical protein
MTKAILTVCAFLLFSFSSIAESFTIAGKVKDNSNKGVPFASIALSEVSDTSVVQFAVSKENGDYTLRGVKEGDYLLVVASVGYDVVHKKISVTGDNPNFDVELTSSLISIEEVMVVASKIPILLNGDTVVYNSSSFKTQANANVEDLIKKMPGIQVNKDGTINVEGEQVTKVMVNGKEFFGGNVEAATKNLDASLVDKVEVIDKKTDDDEFTGEDDNQKEKVINLVLKEEHTHGYFGTVRGGYGTEALYNGHGNINFFKDETQLSIIGGMNNINQNLYGWRAMQTLQSFEITPFNNNNRTWWWSGGVKTYKGVGANIHLEPIKGMKTDVAYVITNEESLKQSEVNSEVYINETTLFSDKKEESTSTRNNHSLNTKIEFEPDTLNRFVFRGQYTTNVDVANNLSRAFNYLNTEAILNSGVDRDDVNNDNEKLVTKLHWTKKNRKNSSNYFMGSVYFDNSTTFNNLSSYYNTVDSFLLPIPTTENPLLDQILKTDQNTLAITMGYQKKLSKKWTVRPGFNWLTSNYNHEFKWISENNEEVPEKSPIGTVNAQNMEYYVHLNYKLDSFTSVYFVPELNQTIEKRSFTSDSLYEYDFNQLFFIPFLWIRSEKKHKYRFRFSARADIRKPNIDQIIPVVDNSNPYATKNGTISLQNYINYNNSIRYTRFFGLEKSLSFRTWTSYSLKPVVNQSSITEDNYSVLDYINFKDRIYNNQSAEFRWNIKKIKARLGLEIGHDYNRQFFIQNNREILSLNNGYSIAPNISFNEFDKFSLELEYEYSWKIGSIDGIQNNPFGVHNIEGEIIWTPIDRIEWSSDLYWEYFESNTTVGVVSIPLLSSSFSVFVDKDKKWSVGVKAYDILDKNQNVWRWWGNNQFMESRTNTVNRYVMGTLTYKINKPAAKDDSHKIIDRRR